MTGTEWRHVYRNADTLELLKVAFETMSAPVTPQLVANRADRRRAVRAIRRIR